MFCTQAGYNLTTSFAFLGKNSLTSTIPNHIYFDDCHPKEHGCLHQQHPIELNLY